MTTLLCTGDLHMGRRPSRLPPYVDGHRFAASAAWAEVVEQAVQQEVHAVILTGDVVDRENRYYEALGPLEQGLRRLTEEGIQTFAVAGNHDYDVFPEIVQSLGIEAFHLLGPRGTWTRQALVVGNESEPRLFLDGWSFPQRHVSGSPLETYTYQGAGVPVLGVLHAEVDPRSETLYSPVRSSELARAGPTMWLLGHRHNSALRNTETEVKYLYPGTPQPLSPDETGTHGPWLVHVSPSGAVTAEQVPTASVRYEDLDVGLDGVDDEAELRTRLHERVRKALRTELGDLGSVKQLVCRLILKGQTSLHRSLHALTSGAVADLQLVVDGTTATIDKIQNDTRPATDLDALAVTRSPSGALARIVLALEEGEETEEVKALLVAGEETMRALDRSSTYAPVFDHDGGLQLVEPVGLRTLIRRQALLLIEELESQKQENRR